MYLIKMVNLDTGASNIVGRHDDHFKAVSEIWKMRARREKGDPWVAGIIVVQ